MCSRATPNAPHTCVCATKASPFLKLAYFPDGHPPPTMQWSEWLQLVEPVEDTRVGGGKRAVHGPVCRLCKVVISCVWDATGATIQECEACGGVAPLGRATIGPNGFAGGFVPTAAPPRDIRWLLGHGTAGQSDDDNDDQDSDFASDLDVGLGSKATRKLASGKGGLIGPRNGPCDDACSGATLTANRPPRGPLGTQWARARSSTPRTRTQTRTRATPRSRSRPASKPRARVKKPSSGGGGGGGKSKLVSAASISAEDSEFVKASPVDEESTHSDSDSNTNSDSSLDTGTTPARRRRRAVERVVDPYGDEEDAPDNDAISCLWGAMVHPVPKSGSRQSVATPPAVEDLYGDEEVVCEDWMAPTGAQTSVCAHPLVPPLKPTATSGGSTGVETTRLPTVACVSRLVVQYLEHRGVTAVTTPAAVRSALPRAVADLVTRAVAATGIVWGGDTSLPPPPNLEVTVATVVLVLLRQDTAAPLLSCSRFLEDVVGFVGDVFPTHALPRVDPTRVRGASNSHRAAATMYLVRFVSAGLYTETARLRQESLIGPGSGNSVSPGSGLRGHPFVRLNAAFDVDVDVATDTDDDTFGEDLLPAHTHEDDDLEVGVEAALAKDPVGGFGFDEVPPLLPWFVLPLWPVVAASVEPQPIPDAVALDIGLLTDADDGADPGPCGAPLPEAVVATLFDYTRASPVFMQVVWALGLADTGASLSASAQGRATGAVPAGPGGVPAARFPPAFLYLVYRLFLVGANAAFTAAAGVEAAAFLWVLLWAWGVKPEVPQLTAGQATATATDTDGDWPTTRVRARARARARAKTGLGAARGKATAATAATVLAGAVAAGAADPLCSAWARLQCWAYPGGPLDRLGLAHPCKPKDVLQQARAVLTTMVLVAEGDHSRHAAAFCEATVPRLLELVAATQHTSAKHM